MTRIPPLATLAFAMFIACSGADPSPAASAGAEPGNPPPPSSAAPGATGLQSCSVSRQILDDRSEYDERCTVDGQTRTRECTLGSGESTWSCLCTAASGTRSACESPAAEPGPPPDCCPAG